MTRSKSLKAALVAASGITSLVGDRIYPLVAPRQEITGRPTLIYQFQVEYENTLSAVQQIEAALDIRCWSTDYDVAHQVADAVQAVLAPAGAKGFNGNLGGTGGINVIRTRVVRETEERVVIAEGVEVFLVQTQYLMTYLL